MKTNPNKIHMKTKKETKIPWAFWSDFIRYAYPGRIEKLKKSAGLSPFYNRHSGEVDWIIAIAIIANSL